MNGDKPQKNSDLDFAMRMTRAIGSPTSLMIHTALFIGIFSLSLFDFTFDKILLILTTLVSLEAIYLSIFIQMTVNQNTFRLNEVSKDVEDIAEDVEDIQEDVEEIAEDVEDIQEDMEGIEKEVKELGDDLDEVSEEMEEDDARTEKELSERKSSIERIEKHLTDLNSRLLLLREHNSAAQISNDNAKSKKKAPAKRAKKK